MDTLFKALSLNDNIEYLHYAQSTSRGDLMCFPSSLAWPNKRMVPVGSAVLRLGHMEILVPGAKPSQSTARRDVRGLHASILRLPRRPLEPTEGLENFPRGTQKDQPIPGWDAGMSR